MNFKCFKCQEKKRKKNSIITYYEPKLRGNTSFLYFLYENFLKRKDIKQSVRWCEDCVNHVSNLSCI